MVRKMCHFLAQLYLVHGDCKRWQYDDRAELEVGRIHGLEYADFYQQPSPGQQEANYSLLNQQYLISLEALKQTHLSCHNTQEH